VVHPVMFDLGLVDRAGPVVNTPVHGLVHRVTNGETDPSGPDIAATDYRRNAGANCGHGQVSNEPEEQRRLERLAMMRPMFGSN